MMSRKGIPAIATVVVFLAFISTFLVIEVLSRVNESLLVINPTPVFYANTLGNLKPYAGGFTYWHPKLPYTYSIDGDGFRKNSSRSAARPDGVIFCLGDSYTFGVSVLDRETYPAYLEQRVNSRFQGRTFKVVNSGMPGVGIEDYYLYYKDKVRQMKPSLVVLQYNVYNLRLLADTYRYTFKSQGIPFSLLKHWVREDDIIKFLNKALSHLSWYKRVSEVLADPVPVKTNAANLEMARAVLGNRKYEATGAINHVLAEDNRVLEEKNQAVIEPLWDRYCEVLLRLKQDVERDGGDFLLVMIPHYRQMNSFENAMSARLGRFCSENTIKYVDLTRKFRSLFMDSGVELYCMPHDFHCSPSGNALIADEIVNRMRLDKLDGGPGRLFCTDNAPDFRYHDALRVKIEFDDSGNPVLAENEYLELTDFSRDNVSVRREGDGSISYLTSANGTNRIGTVSLGFRLKKPGEQVGAVFFPHVQDGDNRSNTFTVKLAANNEEALFSTANSLGPGRWRDLENMFNVLLWPTGQPVLAFTVDFAFVRDAGFIFERKGEQSFRRFDLVVYPAREDARQPGR